MRIEVCAMSRLRVMQEIVEGLGDDRFDLGRGPVMTQLHRARLAGRWLGWQPDRLGPDRAPLLLV